MNTPKFETDVEGKITRTEITLFFVLFINIYYPGQ